MCAPSPPGPKAAQRAVDAQVQGNLDAAIATGQINNPNYHGPDGSQVVTWNGNQPTITQTLNEGQQNLYDQNLEVKDLLGKLGIQGAESLQDILGKKFDFSGAPDAPGSYDDTRAKVQNAMMSRYDQDANQRREAANSDLIARGLRPGTEAYEREMGRMDKQRNDFALQSETAAGGETARAFAMDSGRRKDWIAELISQRQLPLNEIIGLMSGSQVNNPFAVGGFNAGAQVANADHTLPYQALQEQAAAAAAEQGQMMSGLFSLGAGAMMSDRRLKTNIVRVGTHRLGIGIYEFDYLWGDHAVGVMADEVMTVMPNAVIDVGGFMAVDYGMLG